MTPRQRSPRPSDRDHEILRDVIQTYIVTGEPVSSLSVARRSRHRLSPATMRNIMAELEERGLLSQPHASSGRIPTAAGYHFYIDSLMPFRAVSPSKRRYIRDQLREVLSSAEDLMASVTHLLTELSQQIGIVLTPVIGETTLKAIHFLQLTGRRTLCVLESTGGLVEHRVVETLVPMSRHELISVSNYLTDNFSGLTLRQTRDRLLALMADERAQIDRLLTAAITLAQQALDADDKPEVLVEGTETVLSQPELSDIVRVRRLLDTFTDKARLVRMIDQLIEGRQPQVIIGDDSDLTSDLDFSLVAMTYGASGRPLGTLGIFGPSRMDYQKVVPLVDFLGKTLSEALEVTDS